MSTCTSRMARSAACGRRSLYPPEIAGLPSKTQRTRTKPSRRLTRAIPKRGPSLIPTMNRRGPLAGMASTRRYPAPGRARSTTATRQRGRPGSNSIIPRHGQLGWALGSTPWSARRGPRRIMSRRNQASGPSLTHGTATHGRHPCRRQQILGTRAPGRRAMTPVTNPHGQSHPSATRLTARRCPARGPATRTRATTRHGPWSACLGLIPTTRARGQMIGLARLTRTIGARGRRAMTPMTRVHGHPDLTLTTQRHGPTADLILATRTPGQTYPTSPTPVTTRRTARAGRTRTAGHRHRHRHPTPKSLRCPIRHHARNLKSLPGLPHTRATGPRWRVYPASTTAPATARVIRFVQRCVMRGSWVDSFTVNACTGALKPANKNARVAL